MIVKALLEKGWRNQDIQALVNTGRPATINSARITEVKKSKNQIPAADDELAFFEIKKNSFDFNTGLNLIDDERLVRAREAMILSVQIFNSAGLKFKTEVFTILINIAWTYLLHEYYERKGVKITQGNGRSLLLSKMIEWPDSPLSEGVRHNLRDIKIIRDRVEHKLLGKADLKWQCLFQACCLNFNKVLCKLFGDKLSLESELAFAIQFSRMNIEQLATLNKYEIPARLDAVDARLAEGLTDEQRDDLEYQFRVIYTIDAASKSRAHFQFVSPDSIEGKTIVNVVAKPMVADHLYPHKPAYVARSVAERSGQKFSLHNHTQAWRFYKVRPRKGAAQGREHEQRLLHLSSCPRRPYLLRKVDRPFG